MPYPAPLTFQFERWSGVASRSVGYHASGTTIVRPSMRSTAMVSSVKLTSLTRSPGLTSEPCIPFLQKCRFVFLQHSLDLSKFDRTESEIPRQRHGAQPEFGRLIIAINVDMRRFIGLMRMEVHPIWPWAQD